MIIGNDPVLTVAPSELFFTPLQVYDAGVGGIIDRVITIYGLDATQRHWCDYMLAAQRAGFRLPYSADWYLGRDYALRILGSWAEMDFITGRPEWTGTVLDFDNGELLEGVVLREDMPLNKMRADPRSAIVSARRLGRKENILLPERSGYVKDFHHAYAPFCRQLWGVADMSELPDNAYLRLIPGGFRPLVRGYWEVVHARADGGRGDGRVDACCFYSPAQSVAAARFVGDTLHETYENGEAIH